MSVKYLRGRAVIGLELEDLRFRISFRKFIDICKVCAAPCKDRLGVITDDHYVAMLHGEQIDE